MAFSNPKLGSCPDHLSAGGKKLLCHLIAEVDTADGYSTINHRRRYGKSNNCYSLKQKHQ